MKVDEYIEAWLKEKRTMLWLNWDLTDDEERAEAVKFWRKELDDYERFFLTHYSKTSKS